MKNLLLKLTMALSVVFVSHSISFAQDLPIPGHIIGTACEGDHCGPHSNSLFASAPPCDNLGVIYNYQVEIDASNLCPNHDAVVEIWVCGNLIQTVNVQGGTLPFMVPFEVFCDCDIHVNISLVPNNEPILCKRLGYATAKLSTF